jgi:hypothetical protein
MSKRFVVIVLVVVMALALLPTGAALAAGLPTAPIITVYQCTLSVEFDAQVPGYYEVRIWDNGVVTHSQTQAGAFFGDTLVFQFSVLDLAPSGAPGVAVEIVKAGVRLFATEVPIIQGTCYNSLAGGCTPALTADAAVGSVTQTTAAYFDPSAGAATTTVLPVGSTWWVLGKDASGAFYKVLISCQPVWVPVGDMGPNYDAVWNGHPLPTTVVK